MNRQRNIIYAVGALLLIVLWQYSAGTHHTVRVLISSPGLLKDYFHDNYSELLKATWTTFYEACTGLGIATLFSFGVMTICLFYPRLLEYFLPLMVVSQVMPLITLAPLLIIMFGIGATAKIAMSALICFFPIFINFANGVKLIPPNIHELLYINNASRFQAVRYVYFPLCVPYIMSGLKIAATLAVIGAIVAEFSGAETGLGHNLFITALRLEPELMMSSLILSACLGGITFGTIHLLESRLGKWYLKTDH